MTDGTVRLIQAEFLTLNQPTLEATIQDSFRRSMEGSRPIMVIRFFDQTETLLPFVTEYERNDEKLLDLYVKGEDPSLFSRMLANWQFGFVRRRLTKLDARRIPITREVLKSELRADNPVAIEEHPHRTFRFLERAEAHELIERIHASTHVLLFVFPQQDLLTPSPGKVLAASV